MTHGNSMEFPIFVHGNSMEIPNYVDGNSMEISIEIPWSFHISVR